MVNLIKQMLRNSLYNKRKRSHMTQVVFADLLDMDRTQYGKIETGRDPVTIDKLISMCEQVGIKVSLTIDTGDYKITL